MSDFINEGNDESMANIKFDHYDKWRKLKLQQIYEFMRAVQQGKRKNLMSLSLLPKESFYELKKSTSIIDLCELILYLVY